jgi:hypothetical protein
MEMGKFMANDKWKMENGKWKMQKAEDRSHLQEFRSTTFCLPPSAFRLLTSAFCIPPSDLSLFPGTPPGDLVGPPRGCKDRRSRAVNVAAITNTNSDGQDVAVLGVQRRLKKQIVSGTLTSI